MTRSQNPALYPSKTAIPTGRLRSISGVMRLLLAVSLVLLAGGLVGCKDRKTQSKNQSAEANASRQSKPPVPLRVWFVGDPASQELIERQWQATSERPLQLKMLSADELAQSSTCASDVVVLPAFMLGELIERGWLVELPSALQPPTQASAAETASSVSKSLSNTGGEPATQRVQPAGWLEQARYGRKMWGVSLSVTTPLVLANFPLPPSLTDQSQSTATQSAADIASQAQSTWQSLVEALKEAARADKQPEAAQGADADDPVAVCDRFMVVLTSICPRDARFGILFDPETLQPRLSEPEAITASDLLVQLHQSNASPAAILGSPTAAWRALSQTEASATIGLPPAASSEVDEVTSIQVALPPLSPAATGARNTRGWNSGYGLVAALTSDCRQTGQAIEFIRWLTGEPARNVLGKRLVGLAGETTFAPSSSAWQVQRLARRLGQQPRLPNEPRLPGSLQYRRALGEQLVRMLRGEQTAEQAMAAAAREWERITSARDRTKLRTSYEHSLGL